MQQVNAFTVKYWSLHRVGTGSGYVWHSGTLISFKETVCNVHHQIYEQQLYILPIYYHTQTFDPSVQHPVNVRPDQHENLGLVPAWTPGGGGAKWGRFQLYDYVVLIKMKIEDGGGPNHDHWVLVVSVISWNLNAAVTSTNAASNLWSKEIFNLVWPITTGWCLCPHINNRWLDWTCCIIIQCNIIF